MKIPEGMTQEQVEQILQKLSKKFRKHKFGPYTAKDIEQESYVLGMEGLESYNGSAPLENFLSVHIRNRLLNLKRKYGIDYECKDESSQKFLLVYPLTLDQVDDEKEESMKLEMDLISKLISQEIIDFVDANLDINLRMDYLKFINGVKLSKTKREKVKIALIKLLSEYYGKEEKRSLEY